MISRLVRIKKETRALFWPWCAVMIAGALPIFFPHSSPAAKWRHSHLAMNSITGRFRSGSRNPLAGCNFGPTK